MNENPKNEKLDSCVRAVWQRRQKLHFSAGVLAFGRWGVLLFLVGMAIDWMTYMPAPGRVVILVTLLAVSIYKAWRCGWRHARTFNATHTALQIEEHHGGLDSLLVTAVQFRKTELSLGTSDSMRELTCRRAEEAVVAVRPEDVVGYHGLRRPFTAMLALALIIGVFAVVNGPFLATGLARIFPPWMALNYPTRTQLEMGTGDMIVKEGNPALIQSRVSGVIPREATLQLRTGKGKPRLHRLPITDGVCEYAIDSAYRGFEYRIMAGDAQSEWHVVDVISSPRIERAEVSLEFPSYTGRSEETVEALTVTVPEGTNIKWQLTLDRAVKKAVYSPAGGEPQPLDISPDGQTVTMQQLASESRAYSFSWVDKEHGFSFTSSSHYLQVAPDQSPRVELTSPKGNLYATLGRKLELAFRGRDDHGIGESIVAYRVNKVAEEKVRFSTPTLGDGGEHVIDWDYRTALPDLAIGDTVSFVVELSDRYPGTEGPHRARSQARRILFMSEEDYLVQIAKQKRRLMSQLRSIYREERGVHNLIRNLDPSSDVFIQTCQLEAVRQDLMGERLGVLKTRMQVLIDDLAANNITDDSESAVLVRLSSDIENVAQTHVARAAASLRELTAASNKTASAGAVDQASAAHGVDSAARELGCIVLQMGFKEATEVMARELHAVAETQASLRLRTILSEAVAGAQTQALASDQNQLAQWLTRLFGAMPQDKESTIDEALVAFNLSRLIKELRSVGVDTKMLEAVSLIRAAGSGQAARLQADVIRALLRAEFRLRVGSEHEALSKASALFTAQVSDQKKLHAAISALTPKQFTQRRAALGQTQATLYRKLQLLLMPDVPAPRARLFDIDLPPQPPVEDLWAAAEGAMENAAALIHAGDRDKAAIQQQQAQAAFESLAEIVQARIQALTEKLRLAGLARASGKHAMEITDFEERQIILLEKTEDAADDESDCASLNKLEQQLAQDIEKLKLRIVKESQSLADQDALPLLSCLERVTGSMTSAGPSLKANQYDDAIAHQEDALDALEEAARLLETQQLKLSAFAVTLESAHIAQTPGPYVADIQAEQLDMVVATGKAKEADLPHLAIVQKNLIHAVNAVLISLDPLAHQIESGTVFLFAKDDMDAAAIAIADNDLLEAADAGSFVAETLLDLLGELQTLSPQYSYILEVTEFFHTIVSEGLIIQAQQSQLRAKLLAAAEDASLDELIGQQRALETRAKNYGNQLHKATGLKSYNAIAEHMAQVVTHLKAGNQAEALNQMSQVQASLNADTPKMLNMMEILSNVLKVPPAPEHTPDALLVLDVLAVASHQQVLYRQTQLATPEQAAELSTQQRELATRGEGLIKTIDAHAKAHISNEAAKLKASYSRNVGSGIPLAQAITSQEQALQQFFANAKANIDRANKLMAQAATKLEGGASNEAVSSQHQAGELQRHFLLAYIDTFLVAPGPPAPSDPIITDPSDPSFEDSLILYSPGAVSGEKPKGGRQEWDVLGRRDRAALNENFARELPLEYRAILKDYYERLAK